VEPESEPTKVRFGVRVTVQYEDGTERAFTLVGEDEADPARGLISWISPIAQALIGTSVGDEMALPSQRAEVTKLEPGT
jgi:transcription elongation GreA/GreB family factor